MSSPNKEPAACDSYRCPHVFGVAYFKTHPCQAEDDLKDPCLCVGGTLERFCFGLLTRVLRTDLRRRAQSSSPGRCA